MTDSARLAAPSCRPATTSLIETDADATTLLGRGRDRPARSRRPPTRSSSTPRTSTSSSSSSPGRDARSRPTLTADPEHRAHRGARPSGRSAEGPATLELRFGGADQPRPARLLPQHLRRRRRAPSGCSRATQFEAPHARGRVPVLRRARVQGGVRVTLVVADGLLAISNGPEIAREPLGDGRVRVRFGDTIPMSTYLVAWVVGPLELTEPVDAGGVAVRVAHVPGQGAPHARSRSTSARSRSRSSPTTTASRTPARSAISSRSPTSRSARWRTSAA